MSRAVATPRAAAAARTHAATTSTAGVRDDDDAALDEVDFEKPAPVYASTAPAELARRAESLHHAFALPDGEPSSMRNQWTEDDAPPVS